MGPVTSVVEVTGIVYIVGSRRFMLASHDVPRGQGNLPGTVGNPIPAPRHSTSQNIANLDRMALQSHARRISVTVALGAGTTTMEHDMELEMEEMKVAA